MVVDNVGGNQGYIGYGKQLEFQVLWEFLKSVKTESDLSCFVFLKVYFVCCVKNLQLGDRRN